MGLFDQLKSTLNAARGGDVDVDAMSPEHRARYEQNLADAQARAGETPVGLVADAGPVEAASAALSAGETAARAARSGFERTRPLRGPAAVLAYGRGAEVQDHAALLESHRTGGVRALFREQLGFAKRQLANTADDLTASVPTSVADPDQRLALEIAERRARDAARASYRAPDHPGVVVSRIATRGDTQLDDVARHLVETGLAERPDLVFGVARVPDRISPALSPGSERSRVVEWEVLHEPLAASLSPGGEVERVTLSGWDRWVRRSVGEPSVVDEELGIALLGTAGVRADRCLGLARAVGVRSGGDGSGEESDDVPIARVEGLHVFAAESLEEAGAELAQAAPVELPAHGRDGVIVEVLNWRDVALAVHPQPQRMHVIPSPAPYLPSTPQELLVMYLETVGIRAVDCYAAAVTIDESAQVMGLHAYLVGLGSSNLGGEEMCADGKVRRRLHAATHVVIAYDDRPHHVEGRRRWMAYQAEVLQAQLELDTGARRPLSPDPTDLGIPLLGAVVQMERTFDAIVRFGEERLPPAQRYCEPVDGAPDHRASAPHGT